MRARELEPQFRTASRRGQIVAQRLFEIKVPAEGSSFPIQMVDEDVFARLGLPTETVWIINWQDTTDFDRSTEDVLTVLINRSYGERLLHRAAYDDFGAILWREMAVEIFLEIAIVVFGSNPPPPQSEDGLLGKLVKKLEKESGMSFDQLVRTTSEAEIGIRILRAHLQRAFGLGDQMSRLTLAGRAM